MNIETLSDDQLTALIEAGFDGVALHRHFGLRLAQITPIVVEMPLSAEARGFTGGVHGGAIASLVDVASNCAAAFSDQFELETVRLATLDLHIRYLRQPRVGPLAAAPTLIHEGRSLLQVDTTVTCGEGTLLATASALLSVAPIRHDA
jgi:uncharacterized protein (TIGR00369 family)